MHELCLQATSEDTDDLDNSVAMQCKSVCVIQTFVLWLSNPMSNWNVWKEEVSYYTEGVSGQLR